MEPIIYQEIILHKPNNGIHALVQALIRERAAALATQENTHGSDIPLTVDAEPNDYQADSHSG